jgi:hypothetical protein
VHRRLTGAILSREGFLGNRYALQAIAVLLVLQVSFTHLPVKPALFGTADLEGAAWLRVVAAGVLVLLAVELEKIIRPREEQP